MENATVISDDPDARVRRSERSRRSPACMGDFLLGKDFDNALPPLGRKGGGGGCKVAKREFKCQPFAVGTTWTLLLGSEIRSAITDSCYRFQE